MRRTIKDGCEPDTAIQVSATPTVRRIYIDMQNPIWDQVGGYFTPARARRILVAIHEAIKVAEAKK